MQAVIINNHICWLNPIKHSVIWFQRVIVLLRLTAHKTVKNALTGGQLLWGHHSNPPYQPCVTMVTAGSSQTSVSGRCRLCFSTSPLPHHNKRRQHSDDVTQPHFGAMGAKNGSKEGGKEERRGKVRADWMEAREGAERGEGNRKHSRPVSLHSLTCVFSTTCCCCSVYLTVQPLHSSCSSSISS